MINDQLIYTVSDITQLLKEIIEGAFSRITIEGEISNFRPASTGHWYFTLKDRNAAISAVMFKNRIFRQQIKPQEGMKVRITGSLSVYAPRGSYQIICDSIEKIGTGDILQRLEERKRQLAAEGLFDQERKRAIPLMPKHVAVITSPTGAALRDILQVMRRRNAGITVSILPAAVQGEAAASHLVHMLQTAIDNRIGDVIIIGRGGGSVEDLLPFSDEMVVRMIADSPIPVISAVGHEIDWALSDYAADLRAPTPSAAAELVTAETGALNDRITDFKGQLIHEMRRSIDLMRLRMSNASSDTLVERITHKIDDHHMRITDHHDRIQEYMFNCMRVRSHAIELSKRTLESSSPKALLSRGYSLLTEQSSGLPITSIDEISEGMLLETHIADGAIISEVKEVRR